jgi:LPS export ABC transporter protein LptC
MNTFATLTSDDQARARDDRASGHGIVLSGDRTREFSRARWHSLFVRSLRWLVPLTTLGLSALYVGSMLQTAGWGRVAEAPKIVAPPSKDLNMHDVKYDGFTKDGGNYQVRAETATPDLTNPALVKLNTIAGEVFDARKSRTDLAAAHGLYDSKTNQLDLNGGVTVVTQTGMRATLQTATLMTKEGTMASNTPVMVEMPSGVITSNKMQLNQKSRDIVFLESVVAHLVAPPKPDAAAVPAKLVPGKDVTTFGHSNAPVDITSDRLDVHDSAKTAQFSGRVHAVQGLASMDTAVMDITYEGGQTAAKATPSPTATLDTPAAPAPATPATKIKRIVSPGPVVLTQGTGDRVTGNSADFDAIGQSAVILGNVVMTSGIDKRATAERAEFQQASDTILLTGNVVVNSGRNELRGRKLFVDRKAGKTNLTSEAEGGLARSRIFAKLYQGDGQPGKPPAAKKPEVEVADAAAIPGFATFKTDPNAPVDIEADKLAVDDTKKQAVFTGDVKAKQGDFNIRTIELHATYSGEAGLAAVTSPALGAPGAPPKTPAQLTKIEAKGKVIVTSKANQEVTGDNAVFDMKANTALVTGKEVILTQDKNVIRGTKLSIDMATGQSTMVTEGQVATGAGTAAGTKSGRASVLFYPQERPKAGAPPPPKPVVPIKPSASSWESAVEPSKVPIR